MRGLFLVLSIVTWADQPKFEEASVKRAEQCRMHNSLDPGRVALIGNPLKVVLMEAYKVKMDQIIGPSWLETDCFEVIAKIPEGGTRDQLPAMLQALLTERFKLAAHKETRPRSGYGLIVDNKGLKVKESVPSTNALRSRAGTVQFGVSPQRAGIKGSMTMATLARLLSGRLGSPVQDHTGLTAAYDIDLSWTPDSGLEKPGLFAQSGAAQLAAEATPPAGGPGIFTAIRESLGLRLEGRKVEVEVVVIDHIERLPTEN